MKRTHKGFTLVELLIVVAVIGVLAIMMTMSSSEAVDVAGANAIIGNLQALKTAAYQMYIHEPKVGFMTISFAGTGDGMLVDAGEDEDSTDDKYIKDVLNEYLGKASTNTTIGTNYGLVGDKDAWYVVYQLNDTDGVKAKLEASAKKAELIGAEDETLAKLTASGVTYYKTATTDTTVVALKVR